MLFVFSVVVGEDIVAFSAHSTAEVFSLLMEAIVDNTLVTVKMLFSGVELVEDLDSDAGLEAEKTWFTILREVKVHRNLNFVILCQVSTVEITHFVLDGCKTFLNTVNLKL